MTIKPYQLKMLLTGDFRLNPDQNEQFGTLLSSIKDASFAGTKLNLASFTLSSDTLDLLDYTLAGSPDIAANIKEFTCDIYGFFPFHIPSFSSLVNLESLCITSERCTVSFIPQTPNLLEFTFRINCGLEYFPDLRACKKLQSLNVSTPGPRLPSDFTVPGLGPQPEISLASFKKILPELREFSFNLEYLHDRYSNKSYKLKSNI